jgi:hypothetical protein
VNGRLPGPRVDEGSSGQSGCQGEACRVGLQVHPGRSPGGRSSGPQDVSYTLVDEILTGVRTIMSAFRLPALATTPAFRHTLGRRVLRMTTTWAALGVVMGASLGIDNGSVVGAVACMIAGMIEMASMGAVFGLIGGKPQECVVGAVSGLIVGLVTGLVAGQTHLGFVAAFGLVVGALIGATFRPYLRLISLPIVLLVRFLPIRHRRLT